MSIDICYVLAHGFSARMVLQSGLLDALLQRGKRVAIVAPHTDEPSMQALGRREGVVVRRAPIGSPTGWVEYERLRRYVYEDVRGKPSLWAKHLQDLHAERDRVWRRWQAALYLRLGEHHHRLPAFERGLKSLGARLLRSTAVEALLGELQPKLLVSTYPVAYLEAAFLFSARRLGIRTVGELLSWDNITCKGIFPVVPDDFLTWGPIMSEELAGYYGVEGQRITECGVPHFDQHTTAPTPEGGRRALERLGLDPGCPYLLMGMSSPYFAPREIDIVEWLARQTRANAFGPRTQLVVRPHPQNVQGNLADPTWLPRLKELEGARVGVDYPTVAQSRLAWNMEQEDLPRLANLLRYSAVSLNSCSTFSIDAMVHDRPVVLTGFDAGEDLPWHLSVRRNLEYAHYAQLLALGGVRVARSFDALGDEIRAYLADPGRDAEGRARARQRECGPSDGRAAERSAAALCALTA